MRYLKGWADSKGTDVHVSRALEGIQLITAEKGQEILEKVTVFQDMNEFKDAQSSI